MNSNGLAPSLGSRRSVYYLAGVVCLVALLASETPLVAQLAVRGDVVHTMAGPAIDDGVVLIRDGKIVAVGPADMVRIPEGVRTLRAKVVTPGLIDAHSTVGLAGIANQDQDQDQLDRSEPLQPELRAIDAYNPRDRLVAWVRGFGVTTIHTGHAPGELISGQTMIVKTVGNTVEQATLNPACAVACTLSSEGRKTDGKSSPGTRGKMLAMLRAELIKAQEYLAAEARAGQKPDAEPLARDLRLEALGKVLSGELKLMLTAHRAQDIAGALRLAREFKLRIWLDGASEAYLLVDQIKASGAAVIIHPTMARATGERENLSFETASKLVAAGIPVAMQSGYEPYVPKTRVVLFEAAWAAANGLSFDQALETVTIEAAKILGIDHRVGSLQVGRDGDVALYDGDPFQYTSHCTGVVIQGQVVSSTPR